jgi:hypothetical protein
MFLTNAFPAASRPEFRRAYFFEKTPEQIDESV